MVYGGEMLTSVTISPTVTLSMSNAGRKQYQSSDILDIPNSNLHQKQTNQFFLLYYMKRNNKPAKSHPMRARRGGITDPQAYS